MSDGYQFRPPVTSKNTNRVNTSGQPGDVKWRTSLRLTNVIQAGQQIPVSVSGTQFYFVTATAKLAVQPSGGVFSDYGQGEGMNLSEENAFSSLQIKNNNSFPVVYDLFVGFQGFIDNKLILTNSLYPVVAKPTYPIASAAPVVDITDVSGSAFTDVNGNEWYALNRVAIVISNTSSGVTLLLQKADSTTSSDEAVIAIFPQTSIRFDLSGNYRLNLGGANIDAIVSELYNVISA